MGEFEVEITEILSKKIKLKAKDQHEACKIAKMAYENCEIVLGADDFTGVKFDILPINKPKNKVKNNE
jgi:protein dpnD